jgi:hypothetical protein
MKQFFFLSLALILLLTSCESEIIKVNSKDYMIYQTLIDADLSEYYRRNESRSILSETVADKSEPIRAEKTKFYLNKILKMDTASLEFFKEVNDLKIEMFAYKWKLKDGLAKIENTRIGMPLRFEEKDFKLISPKNIEKRLAEIRNSIEKIRREVCNQITSYPTDNKTKFYFNYQKINEYNSIKSLGEKLDSLIETTNVNQDDKEALKKVYVSLTKVIAQVPLDLNSSIDIFNYLTSLERTVNGVLADANALIELKIGRCGSYNLDKILPVVNFPSVAYVGDTIEVSTLMAVYYSFANTSAKVNGQQFPVVKDGMNYIKLVVPNKNEWVLDGQVTIKNKSGVPKSMPWKKTIKILPKD